MMVNQMGGKGFRALLASILGLLMVAGVATGVAAEGSEATTESADVGDVAGTEALDVEGVVVDIDELTLVSEKKVKEDRKVIRGDKLKPAQAKVRKGKKWKATEDAQEALDRMAAEGTLIDLSQLVLSETDSGLLVATSSTEEVVKVTHELATMEKTYELDQPAANGATHVTGTAEQEGLGVQVVQKEGDVLLDAVSTPVGPGSAVSLKEMSAPRCSTTRGSRWYNYINWCYQKFFADGGNWRRPYNTSDDDGSKTRDFYSYKRYATAYPDKTPYRDYAVMEAHVFSWPTHNTWRYRGIRTLDWSPTNGNCATDANFTMAAGGLSWNPPVCIASTDISMTKLDGRMKHYYKCSVCGEGTKKVGFIIGVEVWQGNIPYWYDDNYAAFRQAFTWNWDYANDD